MFGSLTPCFVLSFCISLLLQDETSISDIDSSN